MAITTSEPEQQDDYIWGALILGGVIAIFAWRNLFSITQTEDEVLKVIPNRKLRKKYQEQDDETDAMVLSVDATAKRVGGILRLPKHKRLYYYSFYWTDHFSFPEQQEAHKFDLANALVALVVFQSDIQFFRHRYKRMLVKSNNTIFLQLQDAQWNNLRIGSEDVNVTEDVQKLFDKVQDRLQFYNGEWLQAHRDDDIDMYHASELSKLGSLQYIPKGYNTYEITDWSVQARLTTESNVKQRINHKYTHLVDDYY